MNQKEEIIRMNQNIEKELQQVDKLFQLQKDNYSPANAPSYEERIDRLNRLDKMVRDNMNEILKMLNEDFGTRCDDWSFTADIYPVLDHINHVKKLLKKWMKKERKASGFLSLTGQKDYIINEPLGVIGIMSPFNAPVSLAFDPAVEALAAGNSVMIKVSESTPKTAEFVQKIVSKTFKETEMAVVTGDYRISQLFASLPWDKFVFTGGSEVGKKILAAAAPNLTPVLLELGGKSPCVILEDADVESAAKKIGLLRVQNAGQVCISGDYVLIPENYLELFIDTVVTTVGEKYPTVINNPYFTSIIDNKSFDRIVGYIDEAKNAGSRIVQINPSKEKLPDPDSRKIPLTLIVNPSEDLMVSKYEIFGPILSIYTYKDIDEAIERINKKEKALALYIFGKQRKNIDHVMNNTSSGGVTVNDLLMHANAGQMGFGGVGYSGMGRYKGGFIGYQAFTNPKTVIEQGLMGRFTTNFFPPYGDRTRKILRSQVGVK